MTYVRKIVFIKDINGGFIPLNDHMVFSGIVKYFLVNKCYIHSRSVSIDAMIIFSAQNLCRTTSKSSQISEFAALRASTGKSTDDPGDAALGRAARDRRPRQPPPDPGHQQAQRRPIGEHR